MPIMTQAEKDSYDEAVAKINDFHKYEPTGFNLRDTSTMGIMELCPVAIDGMYWRIDENNVFTKITGATTFGDGVTPLADRTFAHRPVVSDFSFYVGGVKHIKTETQIIALQNVASKQIICYDENGELVFTSSVYEAIRDYAIVSVITGNPTIQQKVIFANERHGKEMSSATHQMLHETDGAKYGTGLNIIGMANNGTTFTEIQAGTIWDEDLQHTVNAVNSAPFGYRDSTGNWTIDNDGTDVIHTNALSFTNGQAVDALYNRDNGDGSWDLVDTVNDYVIMHIFATNDGEFPVIKVVGQNLYPDRVTARKNLDGNVTFLKEGDLPTPEFLHLFSYILDGSGQIETGIDDEIFVDYRKSFPVSRY